jgi:hypothetical protein
MIHKFKKITNGLYRGSAPSPQDVQTLKEQFGIKKIISLDEESGNRINRSCKLLGINHIIIPVDFTRASLFSLFKHNLKQLLLDGGPTYLHCYAGKDRTGLVAAIFECKYLGRDPESAIKETKSLGFGFGLDPLIVQLYEKLIRSCKNSKDMNAADIVSNVREYKGDNRDSYLDQAQQGSFAPYLSQTRQFPADSVYNYINDQSPTRENYQNYKSIKEHDNKDKKDVPLVGIFNNDAGGRGFGPTENFSGFLND